MKIMERWEGIRGAIKENKTVFINVLRSLFFGTILSGGFYIIGRYTGLDWLFDAGSNYLQYVTVILTILAWNSTRKLLKNRRQHRVQSSDSDMILTIELGNGSINATDCVKDYEELRNLHELKLLVDSENGIEQTDGVNTVLYDGEYMNLSLNGDINGALSIRKKKSMPEDKDEDSIWDYLGEFRRCIEIVYDTMSRNSTAKLHVFYMGPTAVAPFFVPYFVNKCTVIMYHWNSIRYLRMDEVDARTRG